MSSDFYVSNELLTSLNLPESPFGAEKGTVSGHLFLKTIGTDGITAEPTPGFWKRLFFRKYTSSESEYNITSIAKNFSKQITSSQNENATAVKDLSDEQKAKLNRLAKEAYQAFEKKLSPRFRLFSVLRCLIPGQQVEYGSKDDLETIKKAQQEALSIIHATETSNDQVTYSTLYTEMNITGLETGAKAGNVHAKRFLGKCFLEGHGVPRNVKKGASLLEEAANMGDERAIADYAVFISGTDAQRGFHPVLSQEDTVRETKWKLSPHYGRLTGDNLFEKISTSSDPYAQHKCLEYRLRKSKEPVQSEGGEEKGVIMETGATATSTMAEQAPVRAMTTVTTELLDLGIQALNGYKALQEQDPEAKAQIPVIEKFLLENFGFNQEAVKDVTDLKHTQELSLTDLSANVKGAQWDSGVQRVNLLQQRLTNIKIPPNLIETAAAEESRKIETIRDEIESIKQSCTQRLSTIQQLDTTTEEITQEGIQIPDYSINQKTTEDIVATNASLHEGLLLVKNLKTKLRGKTDSFEKEIANELLTTLPRTFTALESFEQEMTEFRQTTLAQFEQRVAHITQQHQDLLFLQDTTLQKLQSEHTALKALEKWEEDPELLATRLATFSTAITEVTAISASTSTEVKDGLQKLKGYEQYSTEDTRQQLQKLHDAQATKLYDYKKELNTRIEEAIHLAEENGYARLEEIKSLKTEVGDMPPVENSNAMKKQTQELETISSSLVTLRKEVDQRHASIKSVQEELATTTSILNQRGYENVVSELTTIISSLEDLSDAELLEIKTTWSPASVTQLLDAYEAGRTEATASLQKQIEEAKALQKTVGDIPTAKQFSSSISKMEARLNEVTQQKPASIEELKQKFTMPANELELLKSTAQKDLQEIVRSDVQKATNEKIHITDLDIENKSIEALVNLHKDLSEGIKTIQTLRKWFDSKQDSFEKEIAAELREKHLSIFYKPSSESFSSKMTSLNNEARTEFDQMVLQSNQSRQALETSKKETLKKFNDDLKALNALEKWEEEPALLETSLNSVKDLIKTVTSIPGSNRREVKDSYQKLKGFKLISFETVLETIQKQHSARSTQLSSLKDELKTLLSSVKTHAKKNGYTRLEKIEEFNLEHFPIVERRVDMEKQMATLTEAKRTISNFNHDMLVDLKDIENAQKAKLEALQKDITSQLSSIKQKVVNCGYEHHEKIEQQERLLKEISQKETKDEKSLQDIQSAVTEISAEIEARTDLINRAEQEFLSIQIKLANNNHFSDEAATFNRETTDLKGKTPEEIKVLQDRWSEKNVVTRLQSTFIKERDELIKLRKSDAAAVEELAKKGVALDAVGTEKERLQKDISLLSPLEPSSFDELTSEYKKLDAMRQTTIQELTNTVNDSFDKEVGQLKDHQEKLKKDQAALIKRARASSCDDINKIQQVQIPPYPVSGTEAMDSLDKIQEHEKKLQVIDDTLKTLELLVAASERESKDIKEWKTNIATAFQTSIEEGITKLHITVAIITSRKLTSQQATAFKEALQSALNATGEMRTMGGHVVDAWAEEGVTGQRYSEAKKKYLSSKQTFNAALRQIGSKTTVPDLAFCINDFAAIKRYSTLYTTHNYTPFTKSGKACLQVINGKLVGKELALQDQPGHWKGVPEALQRLDEQFLFFSKSISSETQEKLKELLNNVRAGYGQDIQTVLDAFKSVPLT